MKFIGTLFQIIIMRVILVFYPLEQHLPIFLYRFCLKLASKVIFIQILISLLMDPDISIIIVISLLFIFISIHFSPSNIYKPVAIDLYLQAQRDENKYYIIF